MADVMCMRITKVSLMGYTIIVRERLPEMAMGPNHEITVGLRAAIKGEEGSYRVTPEGLRDTLNAMPDVVAYEILDGQGHGVLVLKEPS